MQQKVLDCPLFNLQEPTRKDNRVWDVGGNKTTLQLREKRENADLELNNNTIIYIMTTRKPQVKRKKVFLLTH